MTSDRQRTWLDQPLPHHKFIAFIDLLGFADLIERLDPDEEYVVSFLMRAESSPDEYPSLIGRPGWKVYCQYWEFRTLIEQSLRERRYEHAEFGFVPTFKSIRFSDSVFIAADKIEDLFALCSSMLRAALDRKVPIRGGLAVGSWFHFSLSSNLTMAGATDISAPFWGSAVVRAYRAESSGLKGLRVFAHPLIRSYVNCNDYKGELMKWWVLLPEEERNEWASDELNQIVKPDGTVDGSTSAMREALEQMRADASAPAQVHYQRTLSALERMEKTAHRKFEEWPM